MILSSQRTKVLDASNSATSIVLGVERRMILVLQDKKGNASAAGTMRLYEQCDTDILHLNLHLRVVITDLIDVNADAARGHRGLRREYVSIPRSGQSLCCPDSERAIGRATWDGRVFIPSVDNAHTGVENLSQGQMSIGETIKVSTWKIVPLPSCLSRACSGRYLGPDGSYSP